MSFISIILLVILLAMAVGHTAFAYRYFRFSPWRSTWQGITLMAQTVTLAALALFYIVDTIAVDDWLGRDAFIIGFLLLLTSEAWVAFICLLHVQRAQNPVSERQGTGYVHPDDIEGDKK